MTSDPIADMLTRVRNAIRARHPKVDVPASNLKTEIAREMIQRSRWDDAQRGSTVNQCRCDGIDSAISSGCDQHVGPARRNALASLDDVRAPFDASNVYTCTVPRKHNLNIRAQPLGVTPP